MARAIAVETRLRGIRQLLSPTINIARDPRCGRTEETYGEDPFLASRMAVAFVQGVQQEGVIATPKHYAANFVGDGGRDSYAIHFSERLMREVYFPAFEAAVKRGRGALDHGRLQLLRRAALLVQSLAAHPRCLADEWGFQGIVVSDYGSVVHVLEKHAVAKDKTDVARRTLEAGLDVELPATDCYGEPLLEGDREGLGLKRSRGPGGPAGALGQVQAWACSTIPSSTGRSRGRLQHPRAPRAGSAHGPPGSGAAEKRQYNSYPSRKISLAGGDRPAGRRHPPGRLFLVQLR